jgi:hypothetical protein
VWCFDLLTLHWMLAAPPTLSMLPHAECAQPDVQPSAQPPLQPDVTKVRCIPSRLSVFRVGGTKECGTPLSPLLTSALQWWGEVAGSAQHRGEAKLLAMCSGIIRCQALQRTRPPTRFTVPTTACCRVGEVCWPSLQRMRIMQCPSPPTSPETRSQHFGQLPVFAYIFSPHPPLPHRSTLHARSSGCSTPRET